MRVRSNFVVNVTLRSGEWRSTTLCNVVIVIIWTAGMVSVADEDM